jgi:hypothetical protein
VFTLLRKGNMKIALEMFDYDVDKKSLTGRASLALRYAKEISLLPVKDYIVHAHIGNCVVKRPEMPGYGDVHPRFGFPNGENDVDQIVDYLRVLLEIGFLNIEEPPVVSFEIKPFGDEDPDIVIANAKRTLNAA